MEIPGYRLESPLSITPAYALHRGIREIDSQSVLVKLMIGRSSTSTTRSNLEREYETTRELDIEGVVPALDLVTFRGGPALILADTGCETLRALLDEGRVDVRLSLTIGARIGEIIAAVHQKKLAHKAIHPGNILVNPTTGAVWLTGLDCASHLPEEEVVSGPLSLEKNLLAYIAPEQTGRMNRRVDYRSDFYSLGVTLYEMMVGKLPFETDDPLELVHAHIARAPIAPAVANSEIPSQVSDVILKLMAKTAEDRYQSGRGVQSDLDACARGRIDDGFVPGREDQSDQFHIPQKLYGRSTELEQLMESFERVASGSVELLLVAGYSGIGKSALVNEVQKPIVRRRGHFVSGKFDQFQRHVPFSAFIVAFQELVRHLLAESEAAVAVWRTRLNEALGVNGQVIVEVIPEIELIIGEQPPVARLPPAETRNRFNLVFERFVRAFADPAHPLVLFLDDLQWADVASLQLLETITTDEDLHHVLVIGAYRDNEVDAGHPLMHSLGVIRTGGARLETLLLDALREDVLSQFVADALKRSPADVRPLASLIHAKTHGNPFFVIQFLKSLHREGLVSYDYESGVWDFDLDRVKNADITDNVVDLMVRKIQRLPVATQQVVKLAACIGNTFDLSTLAIVSELDPKVAAADLEETLQEGLLVPFSGLGARIRELKRSCTKAQAESTIFKFLHDRVQQAAYALIPDDKKLVAHLQVGRLLLRRIEVGDLDERLFDVVGHLNKGAALIGDPSERLELAELNLRAGRKAKSSTAFQPALAHFKAGIACLPETAWTDCYDLAFNLHFEHAEGNYLCGHFEDAERELEKLLERANSPLEQAEIYRIRIVQYENTDRFAEAREWGKKGLSLLGIVFPEGEQERLSYLDETVAEINRRLGARDIESLVDLPPMTDEAMRMGMKLLMTMWAPSYISGDMTLTVIIAAKMVQLSLRFGNVEESAYGYITYAIAVGPRQGDYASAYAFGRLALAVNARFDDLTARAKVSHMFSCYIGFWREPIESCFPHSREAYRAGLESGDFIYAAYGAFHESWHALFSGMPLDQYDEQYSVPLAFLSKTKFQSFLDAHTLMLQWGRALQGQSNGLCDLSGPEFDETQYIETYRDLAFFANFYYVAKLTVLFYADRYEEAARVAADAEKAAYGTRGMIWDAWLCFYHAMILAALHPTLDHERQVEVEQELEARCAQLETWFENSPTNFEPRYRLVRAELSAIKGRIDDTLASYDGAIAAATDGGFSQIAALANERCAKFWIGRGNRRIGGLYLAEAHRRYLEWGALAKVADLVASHPEFFGQSTQDSVGSRPGMHDSLDMTTVLRAGQVISGEIEQSRLLEKLMRIVIENAGAQNGYLLLKRDGRFVVEAAEVNSSAADASGWREAEDHWQEFLPASMVNYVERIGEPAVVADATKDRRFSDDPYVKKQAPLSALCCPITHQGESIGVLYLENNLVRDAFTPDRAEVVRILASQAAISLQNARLYRELERRVEQRTNQLSEANAKLQREIDEHTSTERELEKAKELAESANRAKSEFLANMSHELRTPLNGILGYAQILKRDDRLTSAQRSGLNIIESSGEHLLTLITDILDLSKIEAGKMDVRPVEFNLREFLENIRDVVRVRAEQKGLAFIFEPRSSLPLIVEGDERRLRQVLLNLLGNAVKFTEQGGVALKVDYGSAGRDVMRIDIEDTGVGVPQDEIEAIFRPFHQLHGPDRRAEGTGLGLSISKKLVSLMGGEIGVESEPGKGSIFTVTLSLPEVATFDRFLGQSQLVTGFEGPPKKIMVVDDRSANRAVLCDLLEPLGFQIQQADNGAEALALAADNPPDAFLMDLVMPVMDGFQATREIRRDERLKDVVVIALSASVFERSRQDSLQAGCHDFVSKPVRADQLLDKLREHMGLTWIYADNEGSPLVGADPERLEVEIVAPEGDHVRLLHELALRGDIGGIRRQLDELADLGDEYVPFVTALRSMADDYDMKRINEFVRPFLQQNEQR